MSNPCIDTNPDVVRIRRACAARFFNLGSAYAEGMIQTAAEFGISLPAAANQAERDLAVVAMKAIARDDRQKVAHIARHY